MSTEIWYLNYQMKACNIRNELGWKVSVIETKKYFIAGSLGLLEMNNEE